MPNAQSVQSLIDSFVQDIELLFKRQALEQVLSALQGGSAPSAGRGRKRGRKPGRPQGSTSKIDADRLLAYVKANPGSRGEQIAAGLRTDVKRFRPVMQKLIASKQVRTTGQRRGMQYFAGGAAPRAAVAVKAAKKAGRGMKRGKRAGRRAKRATKAEARPVAVEKAA